MTEWQWFALLVLLPVAIYIVVRIGSSAYFRSKHDYLRRMTDGSDETTDTKPPKV